MFGNRSQGTRSRGIRGTMGDQRLEGHLVEMGLEKNRISGEGYISSLTASRNGNNDEVSESSAQAEALLCR